MGPCGSPLQPTLGSQEVRRRELRVVNKSLALWHFCLEPQVMEFYRAQGLFCPDAGESSILGGSNVTVCNGSG